MSDLFDFTTEVPRFAVMGNPVSHSKSPMIHAQFGRQCGIELDYTTIHVDLGGFAQAVDAFRASGGRGLNITVPFKGEAFQYADRLSTRGELAGAVNTLMFDPDPTLATIGDNTDGSGLVRDIQVNIGEAIAGREVLILGAGGATRGVIKPLADEKPSSLVIANRTPDKAARIALDMNPHLSMDVEGGGLDSVAGRHFDIVINATAASLSGDVPAVDTRTVATARLAYDMMYGNEPTAFMQWSDQAGTTRTSDGFGMLIEQAADAFEVWHKVRPETRDVMDVIRNSA